MKELKIDLTGIAHEIWAVAQLLPEEGIIDGVGRIEEILKENFIMPTAQESEPFITKTEITQYRERMDAKCSGWRKGINNIKK